MSKPRRVSKEELQRLAQFAFRVSDEPASAPEPHPELLETLEVGPIEVRPDGVVRVSFSPRELAMLQRLAFARNAPKLAHGVRNERVDPNRGDHAINLLGLMGEQAVARLLGTRVQQVAGLRGDGGTVDLSLDGDSTVQVKTNHYGLERAMFYVGVAHPLQADFGALAIADGPEAVLVAGTVDRARFAAEAAETDFGHGRVLALPPWRLTPIVVLAAVCAEALGRRVQVAVRLAADAWGRYDGERLLGMHPDAARVRAGLRAQLDWYSRAQALRERYEETQQG